MFIDAVAAARIDRAEVQLSCAIAGAVADRDAAAPVHVARLGGGAAVFVRPGSPINKVIGVGLEQAVAADDLADVEAAWKQRGEPVRVELATVAAPDTAALLAARGYRLAGFEHVLVRPLDATDEARAPEASIDHDETAWLATLVDGFAAPDGTGAQVDAYGRAAIAAVMQDFAAAPGFRRYVARDAAGAAVGAATLFVHEGVALLCGATTLPAARRRGVQASLLAARLRDARRAGCDLAVVTTAPGSQSQRNVGRQGFMLAYARAVLLGAG